MKIILGLEFFQINDTYRDIELDNILIDWMAI